MTSPESAGNEYMVTSATILKVFTPSSVPSMTKQQVSYQLASLLSFPAPAYSSASVQPFAGSHLHFGDGKRETYNALHCFCPVSPEHLGTRESETVTGPPCTFLGWSLHLSLLAEMKEHSKLRDL